MFYTEEKNEEDKALQRRHQLDEKGEPMSSPKCGTEDESEKREALKAKQEEEL